MEESLSIRRSVWVSSLITLVGLVIYIGIAAVLPSPAGTAGLLLLGIFLALIPAAIWLVFFYQQDRTEPEPKRLVVRTYLFGALAAVLVAATPIAEQFDAIITQSTGLVTQILITIFTISLFQELLKMTMVRFVVLGTPEFDRHPDGIVYGLATGLGFATVLTIVFVMRESGVLPIAGAITAVDNALIHGVLGAISGYYIGRVKIDGKKIWWVVEGLAIVTVINAIYTIASAELSNRLEFNPWYSLAVAAALAVTAGIVLFFFFRRALMRASGELSTISVQAHGRSKAMPWDIHARYDRVLISGFVLVLAVSVAAGFLSGRRMIAYSGEGVPVQFDYPAGWAIQGEGLSGVAVVNLRSPGSFRSTMIIESDKTRQGSSLEVLVADRLAAYNAQVSLYSENGRITDLETKGYPAARVSYRYAAPSANGPVVVDGVETMVLVDNRIYSFRYEAEPEAFSDGLKNYERLLASIQFEEQD